jgi:heptose I phosphotransferase
MLTFYSNKKDFKDSSFSDLFNVNGKIIRSGANRETLEFLFKNKKYFIKRFSNGSFLQKILNKLGFVKDISNARNEFEAYQILKEIGVETAKLVCHGDEKKLFCNRSFVISEKIENFEQLDFFFSKAKYRKYHINHQEQIYKKVVQIINKLHQNGIIHHDLYLCHFLLDLNSLVNKKNIKIYLIDFHRLQKNKRIPSGRLIKELGDLLFSVKYFANEELFQEILLSDYGNKNFIETYKLNIQQRAKLMLEKYKNKYG